MEERIGKTATERRFAQVNVVQGSADGANAGGNGSGDRVSSQAQPVELLQVAHTARNGSCQFVGSEVQMHQILQVADGWRDGSRQVLHLTQIQHFQLQEREERTPQRTRQVDPGIIECVVWAQLQINHMSIFAEDAKPRTTIGSSHPCR